MCCISIGVRWLAPGSTLLAEDCKVKINTLPCLGPFGFLHSHNIRIMWQEFVCALHDIGTGLAPTLPKNMSSSDRPLALSRSF